MRARSKSKKKQQSAYQRKKQQAQEELGEQEKNQEKNFAKNTDISETPQKNNNNASVEGILKIDTVVKEEEEESKVNESGQNQRSHQQEEGRQKKKTLKDTAQKEEKDRQKQGDEFMEPIIEQFAQKMAQPSKTITSIKSLKKNAFGVGEEGKIHNDPTKKQNKITKYFPAIISASSISNNTTSLNAEKEGEKNGEGKGFQGNQKSKNTKLQEEKILELRNLLLSKEQEVNKYRTQKEIIEDKYSKLYLESKNYRNKSKEIILKILKEQAARRREEKSKIDSKLGYFTGDMKYFKEGDEMILIRESVAEKTEEIDRLEGELRRCKCEEQKNRTKFSIQFLKKEVKTKKKILEEKEKEQQVYKERIKLAYKEQSCEYALQGWPLIKDSHGNERYQSMELLGKGGFGEVYKCFDLEENDIVAIKINNIGLDYGQEAAENTLKHVLRQVNTQKELKHPNIAQIKQLLELDRKRIVFVLEYCKGPELSVYLKKHKCIEEKDAKQIIYQIFAALNYLFCLERKVIHYDLKPSNIIFHNGTVKILDFGLCKLMDGEESRMDLTSQGVGTYWYLPPETFTEYHSKISSKVDVWSAGVIFFQLLYGKRPFANGISQKAILQRNLIQIQGQKLVFPDSNPNGYRISKDAKQFISQCLLYDPDDRLSPTEAFNHNYFKEYQPK